MACASWRQMRRGSGSASGSAARLPGKEPGIPTRAASTETPPPAAVPTRRPPALLQASRYRPVGLDWNTRYEVRVSYPGTVRRLQLRCSMPAAPRPPSTHVLPASTAARRVDWLSSRPSCCRIPPSHRTR